MGAKKYPSHDASEFGEIRIRSVHVTKRNALQNISDNLGHATLNEFMKIQINRIIDSYPAKMKEAPQGPSRL
jgi:hypothetical protein